MIERTAPKVTGTPLSLQAGLQSGQSDTTRTNTFNRQVVNPFGKPEGVRTAMPEQRVAASNAAPMFIPQATQQKKTQLPEIPRELAAKKQTNPILSFFQQKVDGTRNYFSTVGKNVEEYNAAIDNALKYLPSPGELKDVAEALPTIKAILATENLPVKMNYDNLKTIKNTHLSTTIEFAKAIGEELGMSSEDLHTMEVGAALHDIGKSLIPAEILNKNGRLTPEERKIINLHSMLGYEMLKGLGFGTNVAEIARDHHNPNSKNKMAQIVRAADVYSAMREERPYKSAKSHEEAMAVLNNMNINPAILKSLDKKYGNTDTNLAKTTAQAPASAA